MGDRGSDLPAVWAWWVSRTSGRSGLEQQWHLSSSPSACSMSSAWVAG